MLRVNQLVSATAFVVFGLFTVVAVIRGGASQEKKRARPCLSRAYGEGLSIARHGLYGVDLLSCGKLSVQKKKVGFVSLGCSNELIVEDLDVTVPSCDSGLSVGSSAGGQSSGAPVERLLTPRAVLKDLGLPKVSGIRISRLRIFSLDAQTNRVLRLVAKGAESTLDGLALADCDIMDANRRWMRVEPAILKYDGHVHVIGPLGSLDL